MGGGVCVCVRAYGRREVEEKKGGKQKAAKGEKPRRSHRSCSSKNKTLLQSYTQLGLCVQEKSILEETRRHCLMIAVSPFVGCAGPLKVTVASRLVHVAECKNLLHPFGNNLNWYSLLF